MNLDSPMVAIPLFTSLFFLVVSNPVVFDWTDSMFGSLIGMDFVSNVGTPTRIGLIVHAVLMFMGVYAYLKTYSPQATLVSTAAVAIL